MGESLPIEMRVAEAEKRWPHLQFKIIGDEAHSPCPFCNDGHDRFMVFPHGSYFCRCCSKTGWIDEKNTKPLSREEIVEMRLRSLERKQEEYERRLSALEEMHNKMYLADRYYENLRNIENGAFEYWCKQGMSMPTIDRFKLGYCDACPTDRDKRPSYTIPVIIKGKLYNIRHRLRGADDGDKYRPAMAGLPNVPFNADALYYDDHDELFIVEGEKKSLALTQIGIENNVGIMGKSGFDKLWLPRFERFRKITVALDPDATDQAIEIANLFGGRGYIAELPEKIDDMLSPYHLDIPAEDVIYLLNMARKA